jgi:hypothetical protein
MVFINNTLVMSSMNSGVFNTYEFAPTLVPYYPVVEETAPNHGQKVDNGQYLIDLFLVD